MSKELKDIYKNKKEIDKLFLDYKIDRGHNKLPIKHSRYDISKFDK